MVVLLLLWLLGGAAVFWFAFMTIEVGYYEHVYAKLAPPVFAGSILLLLIALTIREYRRLKR